MSPRSLPRTALLAVLLQLATGCSWAFMTKPPAVVAAPSYPMECTSSKAAPVLDAICAGYFVANGVFWAGQRTCDRAAYGQTCVDSGQKTTGVLLSASLAVLCALSAGSGFPAASRCDEMKVENALCITGNEAACRRLNPAWIPPMKLPVAPASQPGAVEPPATAGCVKDTDCKGDRVCERGACVPPAAPLR